MRTNFEELLPQIDSYIKDYYNSGLSIKELRSKYNVSDWTHSRVVNEFKLKQRSPRLEKQLSAQELEQLKQDIKNGMYKTHLAKKYGVYADKIERFAKENVLILTDGNNERRYNHDESQVIEMFESGMLCTEIAKELNVSKASIQWLLVKLGKTRTESELYEIKFKKGLHRAGFFNKQYPYKGYKMRSKWEVIVAKYLDSHNYNWKYEVKTFNLGNFRYTPDFFVYDEKGNVQFIIEVKGWTKDRDIQKLNLMDILYPDKPIVFVDREEYKIIEKEVRDLCL